MDEKKLLSEIADMFEDHAKRVNEQIEGIKILIENDVTKRIDSLFDGYKLNHEKQYELERALEHKTKVLQDQIYQLEKRLSGLESKIAG